MVVEVKDGEKGHGMLQRFERLEQDSIVPLFRADRAVWSFHEIGSGNEATIDMVLRPPAPCSRCVIISLGQEGAG